MREQTTAIELRTLLVTAIGISIQVWDIAFWLGVHGTIFYHKFFTLWVAATVVLLVALLVPHRDRFLNLRGILALLTPTLWFIINAYSPTVSWTWYDELVWILALGIFALTIPYILYILFELVETDILTLSAAYRNRLIVIVLLIALIGYLVGLYHPFFVSCQQFIIAGDVSPSNCVKWLQ